MKRFVPYRKIGIKKVLVIDGQHKSCTKLSHWGGENKYGEIADDTSAGIVLNAIEKKHFTLDHELVSATHFDIDGFVGVWALDHPEFAMEHKEMLKHMAVTSDFREFDPNASHADFTLKLVSWINRVEKERFYPPFGVENELSSCSGKFEYFLKHFEKVSQSPDAFYKVWKTEFDIVYSDCDTIRGTQTQFMPFADIGLCIVKTPEPVHYYSLTGITRGFDTVLCIYNKNRYELEYKYTTWIDMVSRPVWPRLLLTELIDELNVLEKNDYKWHMDRLADTGPILRLIDQPVPKVIRHDQPYKREIFSSSIPPDVLIEIIVNHFRKRYTGLIPKPSYSLQEKKAINRIG